MKNLSFTIKQLSITYVLNKYLNNDSDPSRVTNKMPYNPSCLINSLKEQIITTNFKKSIINIK